MIITSKQAVDAALIRFVSTNPEKGMFLRMTIEHICNGETINDLAVKYKTTVGKVRSNIAVVLRRLRHPAYTAQLRQFFIEGDC